MEGDPAAGAQTGKDGVAVSDLRYSLQYRNARGFRWKTAKSYDAEAQEFRVVEHVMQSLARQHPRMAFRVIEMPFNVLAVEARA